MRERAGRLGRGPTGWLLAMIAGLAGGPLPALSADVPTIRPDRGRLDAGAGFKFSHHTRKTRINLSGVACPLGGPEPVCLFVFDEGIEGAYGVLGAETLKPDAQPVRFLTSGREFDAEAAAADGSHYYVTGSHGVTRGGCEVNPVSRQIARFPYDPATGRGDHDGAGLPAKLEVTDELWTIMAGHPVFKGHVEGRPCLGTKRPGEAPQLEGRRGVNIEGLAIRGDRLHLGFRGPAENGETLILSVDKDPLFRRTDARPVVTRVKVGEDPPAGSGARKQRGIRDMIAVSDGVLLLLGPDDDNADASYVVAHWDGVERSDGVVEPRLLAQLDLRGVARRDCDDKDDLKPEAIHVVDEPPAPYRAVILSDGLCDGGPLLFTIPR